MTDGAQLEEALGYRFRDQQLLALALTHRSAGGRNNERLEFLGDAILNFLVAEYLYEHFPRAREGELSRMRATIVRGETLGRVAGELGVGPHLRLGSGERKAGGHRRRSILADALEALLGAIMLDGGVEHCRQCVHNWFGDRLSLLESEVTSKDPKTRLQEYLQGRAKPLPEYELLRVEGESHAQRFFVACRLTSPESAFEGSGSSRRRAEQDAANTTLAHLLDAGN